MIPKLHKKGSSFRGAALYLLHDKGRAKTSDRVAWTETRNLATQNPEAAWRVMAATAMDQARLKQEAGIANTGRKSRSHVLHFTLSWHPDEAEGLTREEMTRAALGAIRSLKAEDRQALIVSHDDEPQPHVHVLLNRVSPTDGRILPSSKEKLELSRWAEAYERERGEILCEERALNNAARDRGEYVRGDKEKPRHIFELEVANDGHPGIEKIQAEQRKMDLELRRRTLAQEARHAGEWARLQEEFKRGKIEILLEARRRTTVAKQKAAAGFKDAWRQLYHEQEAERRAFVKREGGSLGKAFNALRSINWRGLLQDGRRTDAIREAFGMLSSSGARSEALRRSQEGQSRALERRQKAAERQAAAAVERGANGRLQQHRERFEIGRQEIIFKHCMEDSILRAEWKERRRQRIEAWQRFGRSASPDKPLGTRGRQTTKADPAIRIATQQHVERLKRELRDAMDRDRDDERGR